MKKLIVTWHVFAIAVQLALLGCDFTNQTSQSPQHIFSIEYSALHQPTTVQELQLLIQQAKNQGKKMVFVGQGKSQGGQTSSFDSACYRVSLQKINSLISLNVAAKQVTVQAGMTWAQLQHYLKPHNLAVKTMQSYNDFSIGGSLAVNVHGQDFHSGPLINSVRSFTLIRPDGQCIEVSRTDNSDLFGLVIGGYGLFGPIVHVTLELTDDVMLEKTSVVMKASEVGNYFLTTVKNDPTISFYSARFSTGDSDLLENALVITCKQSQNQPNISAIDHNNQAPFVKQVTSKGLQASMGYLQKQSLKALGKSKLLKDIRFFLESSIVERQSILSRNDFMSYSIKNLPVDGLRDAYILQEYFIPYEGLNAFIAGLKSIVKNNAINMINVTARHISPDNESVLSFTPREACALVLYIKIAKNSESYNNVISWTRELIDKALACQGSFYLPYHRIATQEQLEKAYPNMPAFLKAKKRYDDCGLFTNQLYEHYGLMD